MHKAQPALSLGIKLGMPLGPSPPFGHILGTVGLALPIPGHGGKASTGQGAFPVWNLHMETLLEGLGEVNGWLQAGLEHLNCLRSQVYFERDRNQ